MNSARFHPNGERVVTASADGSVRVWRYEWEDLLDYLDSSTRVCLSVKERIDFLNEEDEEACNMHRICMQTRNKTPVNSEYCAPAP